MFLKTIKRFWLKKAIEKEGSKYTLNHYTEKINTVGIVFDKKNAKNKNEIIKSLAMFGIKSESVKFITFRENLSKEERLDKELFSWNDFSVSGAILKNDLKEFINTSFDLLINYNDFSELALVYLVKKSNAKFKVGCNQPDKRFFHLTVNVPIENTKDFVSETMKYLKILNKL